jgi:hypothetical protein
MKKRKEKMHSPIGETQKARYRLLAENLGMELGWNGIVNGYQQTSGKQSSIRARHS